MEDSSQPGNIYLTKNLLFQGSIKDPVTSETGCSLKDITDDGTGSIQACLCHTPLCNTQVSDDIEQVDQLQTTTKKSLITTVPILQVIRKKPEIVNQVGIEERPRASEGFKVSLDTSQLLAGDSETVQERLRCYSCGSLLSPGQDCLSFNSSDSSQIATCGPGEACLLYSWRKSEAEVSTIRECFSTEVVLGRLEDPLTPTDLCQEKDISEDGSGAGRACLCTHDLCNGRQTEPVETSQQLNRGKKFGERTKQTSNLSKNIKSGRYKVTTTAIT